MTHLTFPQLGRRIPVAAEQTILQGALDAGVPYPHGCRSGRCGSCRSRLISGDVELGKHSPFALTEEDRANGLILACRSVPTTDVTVEWLDADYVAMPTVAQGATVVAVESKTHDILAIRLKLDDRSAFRFAAGQYLCSPCRERQPAITLWRAGPMTSLSSCMSGLCREAAPAV